MIQHFYRYRQVIKFGIVGVANTVVSFGVFFVLDRMMGVSYKIANPIAYLFGTMNSYFFNRKWTFKSEGKVKKEGSVFFLINGVAWLVQYMLVYFMVEKLKFDELAAQAIGLIFSIATNFLGQKFITFKSH